MKPRSQCTLIIGIYERSVDASERAGRPEFIPAFRASTADRSEPDSLRVPAAVAILIALTQSAKSNRLEVSRGLATNRGRITFTTLSQESTTYVQYLPLGLILIRPTPSTDLIVSSAPISSMCSWIRKNHRQWPRVSCDIPKDPSASVKPASHCGNQLISDGVEVLVNTPLLSRASTVGMIARLVLIILCSTLTNARSTDGV